MTISLGLLGIRGRAAPESNVLASDFPTKNNSAKNIIFLLSKNNFENFDFQNKIREILTQKKSARKTREKIGFLGCYTRGNRQKSVILETPKFGSFGRRKKTCPDLADDF